MARTVLKRGSSGQTAQTRLLELGYPESLPRLLPWPYNTAICFCILSSVSNLTVLFSPALAGGGPATLLWSWIFVCGFTVLTALSLSEICSALPNSGVSNTMSWFAKLGTSLSLTHSAQPQTAQRLALASHFTQYAGGLYFFSSMLSGRHGPVAGWFTGYMNVFGQVAFVAGTEYTTIQLISVTVALSTQMTQGHAYELSPAMEIGISGILLFSQGLLNSMSGVAMGWAAMVFTIWMIGGGLVMSLCLMMVSQRKLSLLWVLTCFQAGSRQAPTNNGPTAFMSGILMSAWALMGYDAAAHMIEETISADQAARWSFILSTGMSFIAGLLYLLGLASCIQDDQRLCKG